MPRKGIADGSLWKEGDQCGCFLSPNPLSPPLPSECPLSLCHHSHSQLQPYPPGSVGLTPVLYRCRCLCLGWWSHPSFLLLPLVGIKMGSTSQNKGGSSAQISVWSPHQFKVKPSPSCQGKQHNEGFFEESLFLLQSAAKAVKPTISLLSSIIATKPLKSQPVGNKFY